MKRRILLYGGLLVSLVLIGISTGLMLREYRHHQASHNLIVAIKANNIPTALAALKAGADPNTREDALPSRSFSAFLKQLVDKCFHPRPKTDPNADKSYTPLLLHLYVHESYDPILVKALLDAGADPNATHDDIDPLGWAAHHGFTQVVRLLLQHGADPGKKGIYGYTALADAAGYITDESTSNKRECVSLILNAGADVNARADDGDTALIVASMNEGDENVEAVRLLLQHHANPNFQNTYGMTALDYTQERNNPHILKLLRQAGAKTSRELAVQSEASVRQTQSSQVTLTATDVVRASVYQYQVAHFGHDYKLSNNLYFVGISANPLHDPSPAVIQSLQSTHYRLKGVTQSIQNTGGVFDKKTKEIGLAFFVMKVRFLSPTKAKVEGGVLFNGKGGHDDIYVVELINGVWKVMKGDIQAVS